MTAHPGPLPVPARITMALNAVGAEGDQVDIDLGVGEPAVDGHPVTVDNWEAGVWLPTPAQVARLAAYTAFPVAWFYKPPSEQETRRTRMFMCDLSRRIHGLTIVESWIDWDGVWHAEEITDPHPPKRRPPKPHNDQLTGRDLVADPDPVVITRDRVALAAPSMPSSRRHGFDADPDDRMVCAALRPDGRRCGLLAGNWVHRDHGARPGPDRSGWVDHAKRAAGDIDTD